MLVGYARTSTVEQEAGLEAQLRDLESLQVDKVFTEQVSSVGKRDQLEAALDYVRDGDTLVVTRLDRLARSTADLLRITEVLKAKGAALKIVNLDIDTNTATGKMLLTMVGAISAFERELMLERQREGIAKAKAEGKYKGRKPTARAKRNQIVELKESGVGATKIAEELGIGRASVYRVLAEENN